MPRRSTKWNNIRAETIEKSQPIGWNPERRQRKMTTDNGGTQIYEPSPKNVERS
jgi:hypothetical protein